MWQNAASRGAHLRRNRGAAPINRAQKSEGPTFAGPLPLSVAGCLRSTRGARADHEGVISIFGLLPPEIFLAAVFDDVVPHLLEGGVLRRGLGVDVVRGLERRLHDGRRERPQL